MPCKAFGLQSMRLQLPATCPTFMEAEAAAVLSDACSAGRPLPATLLALQAKQLRAEVELLAAYAERVTEVLQRTMEDGAFGAVELSGVRALRLPPRERLTSPDSDRLQVRAGGHKRAAKALLARHARASTHLGAMLAVMCGGCGPPGRAMRSGCSGSKWLPPSRGLCSWLLPVATCPMLGSSCSVAASMKHFPGHNGC